MGRLKNQVPPKKKPMQRIYFLLLLFVPMPAFAQQAVHGLAKDAKSNALLAFCNVTWNGNTDGTTSDLDGRFVIPASVHGPISVSRVGYLEQKLNENQWRSAEPLVVLLQEVQVQTGAVTIVAGENPANRIIRAVTENRYLNNPEERKGFSYKSYSKFIFDVTTSNKIDSSPITDSVELNLPFAEKDTTSKDLVSFLSKSHLFMIESVTKRIYRKPDLSREEVLSSRTSGIKNPLFMLLASQLQSFSFYADYLDVLGSRYLSPLAPGSLSRYFFALEDTVIRNGDSVFAISFHPRIGSNFKGLRGIVYVGSGDWAIRNVVAYSGDPKSLSGKIQQVYEKVNGHWFPKSLSTQLLLGSLSINNQKAHPVGIGRTTFFDIVPDTLVPRSAFDGLSFALPAANATDALIRKYRPDSLTNKEAETYRVIDSIGKAQNLDAQLSKFIALTTLKFPIGKISLDLLRLASYSTREGLRLGLGAHTNEKFSEKFRFGGYFGYGLKDFRWKYGVDGWWQPGGRFGHFRAFASFDKDVRAGGNSTWLAAGTDLLTSGLSKAQLRLFDYLTDYRVGIRQRMLRFLTSEVAVEHIEREPTFTYSFAPIAGVEKGRPDFVSTEFQVRLRYAIREKIIQSPLGELSAGSKYPILFFNLLHAVPNVLGGNLAYTKMEARADYSKRLRHIGVFSMSLMGGLADRALPYSFLFNGLGSNDKKFNVAIDGTFQTMGIHEFLSSRHMALFVEHRLGKLLYRKGPYAPSVSVVAAVGFGQLAHPEWQLERTFKSLEKGYYEAGIKLASILKVRSFGLGVGGFYRFGPNSLPKLEDNFAIKLTINPLLNDE